MKPTMLSRAQAYLAYRRALGFELQSEGIQLLNFARYADATRHRGPLTTELAIRWASLPQKADRRYWASRLEIIRRFARHLLLSEPKTQVPPRHLLGPAYRRNPPHLYSSGEIQQLLRRASQLKGRLRPHTFQTLIGLLACSGLRISEALNLKTSDVDLEQLVVVVRQSKWGKSRLVPLHPTALPPLRAYARHRQKLFPLAEQFFLAERGVALTYTTVRSTFRQLRSRIPYSRNVLLTVA
jgi:site-specific recombinase XerD